MRSQAKALKHKLLEIKKDFHLWKWEKIIVRTEREYYKGKFVAWGEAKAVIYSPMVSKDEINKWYEYINKSGLRTHIINLPNGLCVLGIIREAWIKREV